MNETTSETKKIDKIDLNEYAKVVDFTMSKHTLRIDAFNERLGELEETGLANLPRLLNAIAGIQAEGGELGEIVKKIVWQGKPLNEETVYHMKRELGDICYYLMSACAALDLDPNEVMQGNIDKVLARYPNGFEVERSENRASDDI